MKHYLVYRHITPDGKSYVGCTTKSIQGRWNEGYLHCVRFNEAVKEYGWNGMKHEIIAENLSEEEAFNLEIEMIAKFQSDNPKYGYNISKGGKSTFRGLKHTEKTKRQMSASATGRVFTESHCRNLSNSLKGKLVGEKNPMYGKPKSLETIKKQYKAHKKEMKPIIQKDANGNVLNIFFSMHEATRRTGVNRNCIKRCAEGYQKLSKGFMWEYGRGDDIATSW